MAKYTTIDLSELYETLGDNVAIKTRMLSTIHRETQEGLEKLNDAVSADDLEEVRYYVHKMKAAAGYLGMKGTFKQMSQVEAKIKEGCDFSHIEQPLNAIVSELQSALPEVETELERLK